MDTKFIANGHGPNPMGSLQRSSFPDDFIFGTAAAAYQFEGAAKEGGRGPSIWDTFTHKWPDRISDGSSGDTTVDFYHHFKEDVQIMKKMGFESFRFSISWSRLLPSGKLNGGVNKEGVKFYNDLIDELLDNGITPFVTLFHWDLPQTLEDAYCGFLSSQVVADFCDFAELCFWEFGDRVKHWITLNEPSSYSIGGYVTGKLAPGRGPTDTKLLNCSEDDLYERGIHTMDRCRASRLEPCDNGDPATEPYTVTHNQLLAHAAAVDLYRQKYQECQMGEIGITLVTRWMVPYSDSQADIDAANRALDFMFGWFMDPLVNGDYPSSMKTLVGSRLPKFSEIDSTKLKGSFDFIGINYYTSQYVVDAPKSGSEMLSYATDPEVKYTFERDGVPIGPKAGSDWLYIVPHGIHDLLMYTKTKYKDPPLYITENGMSYLDDCKLTLKAALVDDVRKDYYVDHLRYLREAMNDGVNVKGYFAWSFADNFEWSDGYIIRFGIIHVDYKDGNLTRYPKESAIWFMNFLRKKVKIRLTK